MNQLAVYQDTCATSTSISNVFIDMFMKDANDAQLKIYLYLIRSVNANLQISISDMADKFNHTEKDVIRSLQYWERNGLISLDYDVEHNISGIHLHTVPTTTESVPKPLAQIVPLTPVAPAVTPSLPSVPPKPDYSADTIQSFSQKEEFKLLLGITEQYLGRTLKAGDIRSILYIYDELKFTVDMIDLLLQYCVERNKHDFRYIETVAQGWFEQGIKTPKQAKSDVSKYEKTIYTIMKALGKSGTPTAKEVEFINRWTSAYGFTTEVIEEACARTVLATDMHRFEYADGILAKWKKEKAMTLTDVQALDASYKKAKLAGNAGKSGSANKYNQFTRTNYDFDAIERDLRSN